MKLYYVRHGQTDWNVARKMQGGASEKELNETGIEQAKEAQKLLKDKKYDIVISSPMNRAIKTAEIINEGRNIEIITDERIRERKLGELEGHQVTPETEKEIWDYNKNIDIKGGENLHQFEKRILDFINEIKEKYSDKTVLVVAHGGVAKVLKAYLYGMPNDNNLSSISMENCEIVETDL